MNKNNKDSIVKGKRAVAYFDILGFKNKIDTESIEEMSSAYEKLIHHTDGYHVIDENTSEMKKIEACKRYIFSDSIFLIANGDTEDDFVDLISYIWRMMQLSLASGYPLRGAVVYGDVYVNYDKNIFLGKSIVEAVQLESKQNWMGGVIAQSAVERYQSIFEESNPLSGLYYILFPMCNVPFKDKENGTKEVEMRVINWRCNIISEVGIKPLFKNEPYRDDVQEKINNTLEFSKSVVDNKFALLKDDKVPQRLNRPPKVRPKI